MRLKYISGCAFAALLAIASTPAANAADLSFEPPSAGVAVEGFSWTGAYVGGAIGYAFTDLKVRNRKLGQQFSYSDNVDTVIGSAYAGYNYQFGSIVAGAEADISIGDFGGKGKGCPAGGAPFNGSCKANGGDLFGTIRGRVGYAFDRFLIFGTGGLAIGDSVDFRRNTGLGAPFSFQKKSSGTRYGYTLGGGVDYAITDNLILRGEYQYVNFGTENVTARNSVGGTQPAQIKQDAHIIRAGVAYKF